MKIAKDPRQSQSGLSLIELMVALAVSAILLLGVSTIYTASKRSYQVTGEFAELQENARFALNVLSKNIRMAGFSGCGNLASLEVNNISGFPNYAFTDTNMVTGYKAADSFPDKPPKILPTSTNAIAIRKAAACAARVTSTMPQDKRTINVTGNCDFKVSDVILITDCESADIIQSGARSTGTILKSDVAPLSKAYGKDAFAYKLEYLIYFIQNNIEGKPSLHQQLVGRGTPTELVTNVDDLVFQYGEDTSNPPDNSIDVIRTTAAAVTDWTRVINIYARLLLRSEPVGTAIKDYSFNGTVFSTANNNHPGDTRYRKEFVTAINLRNRTP